MIFTSNWELINTFTQVNKLTIADITNTQRWVEKFWTARMIKEEKVNKLDTKIYYPIVIYKYIYKRTFLLLQRAG